MDEIAQHFKSLNQPIKSIHDQSSMSVYKNVFLYCKMARIWPASKDAVVEYNAPSESKPNKDVVVYW